MSRLTDAVERRFFETGDMTLELAGSLAVLALVDSLSLGTLVIPLFFLLAPGRLKLGRILTYLVSIAAFYLVVGVAIAAGASALVSTFAGLVESRPVRILALLLGVGLFALSFWIGRKRPEGERAAPGRLTVWRDRAMAERGSTIALVAIAVAAGLSELATMLPYLGAIGMLTTASLDFGSLVVVLACYCVVMIAPALLLTVLRLVARQRVEPALARFATWMQRNAAETTAWIVAIVGFLIAREAAVSLGITNLGDVSGLFGR